MGRPQKKISDFDVALGAIIRMERAGQKISQKTLSRLSGVALSNLQRREDGVNEITVSELERIAPALGLKPLEIVEKALLKYGGMRKLLSEYGVEPVEEVSEPAASVQAHDNVTYLGRLGEDDLPERMAADTNPKMPPKE